MCATKLNRCAEMAALLLDEQLAVVSFLITTPLPLLPGVGVCPTGVAVPPATIVLLSRRWSPAFGCTKADDVPCVIRRLVPLLAIAAGIGMFCLVATNADPGSGVEAAVEDEAEQDLSTLRFRSRWKIQRWEIIVENKKK